jgi:hypothetical protein
MPIFDVEWRQVVQQYWNDEIEADSEEEAKTIFLDQIQGTEPLDEDCTNSWFDIVELD